MHYYKFNIADYRKDTAHLTPIEHYIYRTLIDNYYLDEKPIPKETQSVMRRLSLDYSLEQNLKNVLHDFFDECEEGFKHKRIDAELHDYVHQCETNKVNGHKGGRPTKPKETDSVIFANRKKPNRNPNQEPITINQEPITNNKEKPVRAKSAQPFPEDFELNQKGIDYANERFVDIKSSFDDFKNYHQAKGTKMSDWNAAWRTWCNKAVEYGKTKSPQTQETQQQRYDRMLRAAL